MKALSLAVVCSLMVLQACTQQPGGSGGSAPPPSQPQAIGPSEAELSRMVKSQELYYRARKVLDTEKNPEKCFSMLEEAIAAAKSEKNLSAAVLCRETQAKLRITQSDTKGAIKILETSVAEFKNSIGKDMSAAIRLDGLEAFLASLYAKDGNPAKAESIYKQEIAEARKEKPANHQRVAFWLRNYSEFYRFKKDEKKRRELEIECDKELKKKP